MQKSLDEDINRILASLDEGEQENTQPLPNGQPKEEYDVYIEPDRITVVKRPEPPERIIESVPPDSATPVQPVHYFPAIFIVCLELALILSCLAFELYLAFIVPSAIITITSREANLAMQTTLTLPAKVLPPINFTKTQTVTTSGRVHQAATQAHGYVTFYNSLTEPQTIDAGTLLVGSDGVQVVTDEKAYIPAGNLSTNGQRTISAHALNYGTEGNIAQGDIYGACCKPFIQAVNSAFTRGQDQRDYQAVAKEDIDAVVNTLTSQFQQRLQETLSVQVPTTETLITPVSCHTGIQTSEPIGAEARQVSVTVSQTCQPTSFNTDAMQRQAESILTQKAYKTLGNGYTLLGDVAIHINKTVAKDQRVLIAVSSSGTWARQYHLQHLAILISGKSQKDAQKILLQQQGVEHIQMQVSGTKHDFIPTNPVQIHFQVIYEPG